MAGSHRFFVFIALGAALITSLVTRPAVTHAEHVMCDRAAVGQRTQTVSIDPDLAGAGITRDDVLASFQPWNDLFLKYHGFAIFAEHQGAWDQADILITAHSQWNRTWVSNRCVPGFVQRGANHSILYIGKDDSWRNQDFLPHELGHTLGFGDHGAAVDHSPGHVGFQACNANYIGVMSYCTSLQSWFLDYVVPGAVLDAQLVQRYRFGAVG